MHTLHDFHTEDQKSFEVYAEDLGCSMLLLLSGYQRPMDSEGKVGKGEGSPSPKGDKPFSEVKRLLSVNRRNTMFFFWFFLTLVPANMEPGGRGGRESDRLP